MEQVLLKVPEAARALSVSRAVVYQMIERGDLRVVRVGYAGRGVRIPATELVLFAARNSTVWNPHHPMAASAG